VSAAISAKFGESVAVKGGVGRSSSFEVSASKPDATDADKPTVIFSKLKAGGFPEREKLLEAIGEFMKSGTVADVPAAAGGCEIM